MTYELLPFRVTPERVEIVSNVLRRVAAHDTLFSAEACEASCIANDLTLPDMCEGCRERMRTVAAALSAPGTRAWEVWNDTPEVVGLFYFTNILPGVDAKAHYVFFDSGKLGGKTHAMKELIEWAFTRHEGWEPLRRLTIEIPAPFAALARHASRKLGFGGPFTHVIRERRDKSSGRVSRDKLRVEGVKRGAVMWRGNAVDLLVLGLQAPNASNDVEAPASHEQSPALV